MAYKSKYRPENPDKYVGDPTKIVCRSTWERKMCKYMDKNKNVLRWASEEIAIPYISPVDNKPHRYYVDFIVEVRQKDGTKKIKLIEVKPKKQCSPPKKQTRKTKRYITEVKTWGVNSAKWKAATEYAENRGWEFQILTEKELQP